MVSAKAVVSTGEEKYPKGSTWSSKFEEGFLEEEEPQQGPGGPPGEGVGGKENRIQRTENSMCKNRKGVE